MELTVYLANVLYMASYFMKDILRLRILTVIAATLLVSYFYYRPEPLMTVVVWNLFFIGVNLAQIWKMIVRKLVAMELDQLARKYAADGAQAA